MKDRILDYLSAFARGEKNSLAVELAKELNLDDATFAQYAQEALSGILHQYDKFSVSTIDAFFQKVIRSFTRESGFLGDYRLEVEQEIVMEEVIANLLDELKANQDLTDWVVEFVRENLEQDRGWDIRYSLMDFSKEIFREEYKIIEPEVLRRTSSRKFFTDVRSTLWSVTSTFARELNALGNEALSVLAEQPWTIDEVKYGQNSGLLTLFRNAADAKPMGKAVVVGSRMVSYLSPANWPSSKTRYAKEIMEVARQIAPVLEKILHLVEKEQKRARSAEAIWKNLYVFGLVSDISRKLQEYKQENNLMLLADAPQFLNGIIQDSDTPFIYEKIGSFYRHFLIDEFQDTSGYQWKNFFPLLMNGLDQGHASFIVGDVKQAIYRWRGGDLTLLHERVDQEVRAPTAVENLDVNYRSAQSIVQFNNHFFPLAAADVEREFSNNISADVYRDVQQKQMRSQIGFVSAFFFAGAGETTWKDVSLNKTTSSIQALREAGVLLKDIAILVRTNAEGQQVVEHLIHHEGEFPAQRLDVVSNESLRIDESPSIRLIIAALHYLQQPEDAIARAQLAYEWAMKIKSVRSLTEIFPVSNQVIFESYLPEEFTKQKSFLKRLPLFELTETLIGIFHLQTGDEYTYLQSFQDIVLEFSYQERNDLNAFLLWWEQNREKKSIQMSADVDAIQVITVHKSKGLQFKYVIIPFCSWNMDHDNFKSPNLWVKSDEPPFSEMGYFPVRYASSLKETFFNADYERERQRAFLDNLNLLYVAFTRAESGLLIMANDETTPRFKKSTAELVYNTVKTLSAQLGSWSEQKKEWHLGVWPKSADQERAGLPTIRMTRYPVGNWRSKLVIKRTAENFFDDSDRRVASGIKLHAILSRLNYGDEIEFGLDQLLREGLISDEEKEGLLTQLQGLMSDEEIGSWFSRDWQSVRTEVPILLPDGKEKRIDRLLTNGQKAVVIDFKTGRGERAHEKQVLEYMGLLTKMDFTSVKGFLLYLQDGKVVSVVSRNIRKVRRKDDSQLALDL